MKIHRRNFLKKTAAASLAASSFSILGAQSASKIYRTALVGTGWWGMNILGEAIASKACKVVGLCDVDRRFLEPAAEKVEKLTGSRPKTYRDFRDLMCCC